MKVALPLRVASAWLVAVTVMALLLGRVAGAVYWPGVVELLMVPVVALPPTTPLTDQVTAVMVVPVTVAVNCSMSPARTVGAEGETVTVICACEGRTFGVEVEPPPQPTSHTTAANAETRAQRRIAITILGCNL